MSVFRLDTHEASRLPCLLDSPVVWRMLDASERRTGGIGGSFCGAGREQGALRHRRGRQSGRLYPACPAEGEFSRSVRERSAAAGTQDRGRRHTLGHNLGECSGRALQRGAAPTTPQRLETRNRAISAGIAAADDRDPNRTGSRARPASRHFKSAAHRFPRDAAATGRSAAERQLSTNGTTFDRGDRSDRR